MVELDDSPSGIVTFVFTDIEGSSRMTRALEEREGREAYERHLRDPQRDRLLGVVRQHGGREVQRAGDGHLLVFPLAEDALTAVVAFQRSLDDEPISYQSGDERFEVRVRIGVHTSEKERRPEIDRDGLLEYPGGDTNFAARIGSLGAGGQIIISEETHSRYAGPREGLTFYPWENRLLKSFDDAPQTVYEVLYRPGQEPREPGGRFFPAFYVGEKNRYIERLDKEEEVCAQFRNRRRDGTTSRLVTIWAEGGMGKTRLGVACAVKLAGLFEGRVHLADLAAREPKREAVAEAIARALDLPTEASQPDRLLDALRMRKASLILLDNAEAVHDEDVARFLAKLATETPGIYLLVMSRTKVGVSDVERLVSLNEGMTEPEARALFLATARREGGLLGDLSPDDEAQICRIITLTERIPLAIELAAAWTDEATLKEIADGLEATPLGDYATLPPDAVRSDDEATRRRHIAMVRSLDWSYDLLGRTPEVRSTRRTFTACGLFADTFTAEAVAALTEHPTARTDLARLHRASLVRRDEAAGVSRYFLHRFTRDYAARKLVEFPDADDIRQRFVAYYVAFVEQNTDTLNDLDQLALLDREWRNVAAASTLAEALGDHDAVMLLSDIGEFLEFRGLWSESERLKLRAVEAARATEDRQALGVNLGNLGILYSHQGRWAEAEKAHDQALKICREFKDRVGEGQTLIGLGVVYRSQGRWAGAEKAYDQALQIKREFKDRVGEGQTLGNLGVVYQRQGRWAEAEKAYDQALQIKREFKDRVGEGQTLNNLGVVYESQGRWAEAEKAYDQALQIKREFKDRVGEGQTLNNLGVVYQRQGRWAEAEKAYDQALKICREFKDRVGEGQTLNNLGVVYESQGRWAEAEKAYDQALQIKREFKDRVGEGLTLIDLGNVYQRQGRWAEAEKAYDQALQIKREFKDRVGEGQTLNNLGVVYRSQGRWAGAEKAYDQALQIKREFKDRVGEGLTLIDLGNVYQRQGRWAEAEKAYDQALQIKREFKDRVGEGQTLIDLGNVYQRQGRWAEAEKAYDQALQIKREFKDRVGEGQTLNNLGVVYRSQGRWAGAEKAYDQALQIKREFKDRVGEGQTLGNLGVVYQRQGRWAEAEKAYDQALQIKREFKDRVGEGQTLNNLGLLWDAREDRAKALQWTRQAVDVLEGTEAASELAEARKNLARLEGGAPSRGERAAGLAGRTRRRLRRPRRPRRRPRGGG